MDQVSLIPEMVPDTVPYADSRYRTTCRSCGAAIWMLPNDRTGRRGPVDVRSSLTGPIVIVDEGEAYHVLSAHETTEQVRYTNHFQTCPTADQHGGRKRR